MPIIVVLSPKGGAGKTTTSLILGNEFAHQADVAMIDADPNRPIFAWSKGDNKPARMTVISDVDEDNIGDRIDEAAAKFSFVIVDLEGSAAKIAVVAVSMADFVIIPTQGSALDAVQANKAIKLIRQQERTMRRADANYVLPYGVLFTRTKHIRSRTISALMKQMEEAGILVFKTELSEREAFKAMFVFNEPLTHLDPKEVANIDKAITNAKKFANEVVEKLRSSGVKHVQT